MKKKKLLFAWVVGALLSCGAAGEEIIYRNSFDSAESLAGWMCGKITPWQAGAGRTGSGGLMFRNLQQDAQTLIELPLNLEKIKGGAVQVSAWLKADSITRPSRTYLGPKVMLAISYGDRKMRYPDQIKQIGSYDWRKFTVYAKIPRTATAVSLCLGLQGSSGTLWIDDVSICRIPGPAEIPAGFDNQLTVSRKTRYRGVMSGNDLSPAALRELGEVWQVNLIRFQMKRGRGDNSTEAGFRQIVADNLARLDRILPEARKYGIRILLDMHSGPGTRINAVLSNYLSWDPKMQQLLADVWREIALKYKDEPLIWGYDLLNEPREDHFVYRPGGGLDWNRLAEKVARAVRSVDPEKPIIIESAIWGSPDGFEELVPIAVPRVIYSFHFYSPHAYTHQGVNKLKSHIPYPGVIEKQTWNRAELEKTMRPVIEFQKRYQVPIFVGEFGVVRWAPGAEQWLEDVISLFEKYGWDWTYHAFREFHGWDAEIGSVPGDCRRIGATPRRNILLRYLKRNHSEADGKE